MSDEPPHPDAGERLTLAEAFRLDSEREGPTTTPPRRRRRRRSRDLSKYRPVPFVAGAAAVLAATSGNQPTGWEVSDALWTGAFAALVSVACVPAKRWTWIVMAGTAAVLGQVPLGMAVGVVALGIALFAAWKDRREPALGALVGGLAVQSLLRLEDPAGEGSSAVVALVAVAFVLASGWSHARSGTRRRLRFGLLGLLAVYVVAAAGFGISAFTGQSSARAAQSDTDAGMRALRQGRPADAEQRLARASAAFDDAHRSFAAPWALPARALPFLGLQAGALDELAQHGASVTASGADGARSIDYERLRPTDGTVDLVAVRATQAPFAAIVDSLASASVSRDDVVSTWLLPPLRTVAGEFYDEVDATLPDAEVAAEAVQVAPTLLGGEGPRRYLLAFAQPAEARYMGGFIGSYGFLTAVDGHVELERSGSIGELTSAPGRDQRTLSGPPEFLARYGRFDVPRYLQNLSATPDLPTLTTVATELIPQTGFGEIDGVVYVDPHGLAALLRITGPVLVEGLDEPLSATNAVDLLLREQYELFPPVRGGSDTEQEEFLADAAESTFDSLLSQRLPSPSDLADSVGTAARGNHLMASVHDPAAQAFLERVGGSGAFPATPGQDWFSVRQTNANPNKVDAYLEREVSYAVVADPATGAVQATATVTFTNTAPPGPAPGITQAVDWVLGNANDDPIGTNRTQVAVFSPLELTAASLDGRPAAVEIQPEFGGRAYGFTLVIPPGGSTTLTLDLVGSVDPGPYRLAVSQPGQANPDELEVTVRAARGRLREATGLELRDGVASLVETMTEDLELEVR